MCCFMSLMKKVSRVACRIISISALLTPILCIVTGTNALGQGVGENQYLWQTNASGNDVHVVNVSTRTVVKRLVVGPNPHGIAAPDDARVVYISVEAKSQSTGELIWVDPRTYEITYRMTICRKPHAIATTPDGRWVYVPCADGRYWVIDATKKQVVKKIKTGGRPHNTQASRDGKYVYLSARGEPRRVTIVDVKADHKVIGEIPFSESVRPSALSADNKRFYQHIDGLNGFQVADVGARKVIATVHHTRKPGWFRVSNRLGWFDLDGYHRCHGLAIRPDQKEIWSCCGSWVNIHSLTQVNFPQITSLRMIDDAYWLTFTPDSKYSFIAVRDKNKVAMVDTQTKEIITHIKVGDEPKRNLVITLSLTVVNRQDRDNRTK